MTTLLAQMAAPTTAAREPDRRLKSVDRNLKFLTQPQCSPRGGSTHAHGAAKRRSSWTRKILSGICATPCAESGAAARRARNCRIFRTFDQRSVLSFRAACRQLQGNAQPAFRQRGEARLYLWTGRNLDAVFAIQERLREHEMPVKICVGPADALPARPPTRISRSELPAPRDSPAIPLSFPLPSTRHARRASPPRPTGENQP